MNLLPRDEKSRGLILTVIAVVGVVGYVVGVFLPRQKTMASKRKELREKQQFIKTADGNIALSAALEEQLKAIRHHVDRWRQDSSAESVAVTLFGEIAALATESGVALHRLTPQDPAAMNTIRQQTLDLEIEGDFHQLLKFLHGIEARPETIWVPRLELQSGTEDGVKVQCALSLVIFADNRGNSG